MATLEALLGTKVSAEGGEGYDHVEAMGERHVPFSQEEACLHYPIPSPGRNLS